MGYDDISDYDYVCVGCGESVEAREFFCGMPVGLPEECPECGETSFISRREDLENERTDRMDAAREDNRLYGLRADW